MPRFNAVLRIAKNNERYLWVDSIERTFALAGTTSQGKYSSHFYGRSNKPGMLIVSGRVPTQDHYDRLAEFIRHHQYSIINSPGTSNLLDADERMRLLTLIIPSEGVTLDGVIENFLAGRKRFNPAPPFKFEFRVIRDQGTPDNNVKLKYPIISFGDRKWDIYFQRIKRYEIPKTRIESQLEADRDPDQYGYPLPTDYDPDRPGGA